MQLSPSYCVALGTAVTVFMGEDVSIRLWPSAAVLSLLVFAVVLLLCSVADPHGCRVADAAGPVWTQ